MTFATPVPVGSRALTFEPTHVRGARPHLRCTLTPAINEHVEAAHVHTLRWAVDMGLVRPGSTELERLTAARFTWLAARAYPTVGADALALVSDWITFLFFYDDLCDTQEAIDPDHLRMLVMVENRLVELGHGAATHAEDAPLARSLAHIRARAAASAGRAWLERFGTHIREYIEGCRWERLIRFQGRIPSLATYSKLRPLISAVFPCFDLAGMCVGGASTDVADHVLVQQLEVMANNYISWVNDIYGLDKELRERTSSNIVVVIAHQLGLGWDEALDRAIKMCNAELEAFVALERQLDRLATTDCRAYVGALEAWMRGNLDWYSETKRYTRDAAASASTPRRARCQ